MGQPEILKGLDKSWDHPWTTDEMKHGREEWSLAADAGLLEHLKQFSNNLMDNVEKTKEKLNCLTSDLNETLVIVDNITNASLALANTQFIESRVRDDDVETKQPQTNKDEKIDGEKIGNEDLISSVSKSIKQGLSIMDEKFQRWEVDASDSEDEGETPIPSVILKPRDPYQNRPLPYVIGSEKWKASNRVGLELSSSESEAPEGEEESASQGDNKILQSDMIVNDRHDSLMQRSSSTSSESSDRNERGNNIMHYSGVNIRTDKLEAQSQHMLDSGSEIVTPTVSQSEPQNLGKGAPSFADELAKRLGKVLPIGNSIRNSQEVDQASINRSKDDLFASDNGDIFGVNPENPFTHSGSLFDTDVSSSLWKDKPIRVPKTNIIPPCLDVPPPIHDDASKPRSAFDDLCGDADSEDSDDIFACKPTLGNVTHQTSSMSGTWHESGGSKEHKFLKIVQGDNPMNIATSTPETNDVGGVFGDASEGDEDDLFGNSVKSSKRLAERSPEVTLTTTKDKPQGLSITQADTLSSNLESRLFQRVPRQNSPDSTDSETSLPIAGARLNQPISDDSNQNSAVSNQNKSDHSSIVAGNARSFQVNIEDSDSSGISIRPNSISNTFGLSADFQPQSECTRLRSEEIYRERIASDSLFAARTRPLDGTNFINNSINQPREIRVADTSDSHLEEDFYSDDVFGPPPLTTIDSKSKSEVESVDDLFLNISSESRLRESSDLQPATEPQSVGNPTAVRNRGLFDEDVDIFGGGDVPDIDIFSPGFTSTLLPKKTTTLSLKSQIEPDESSTKKTLDLLSTGSTETVKTFPWGSISKESASKPNSIFDDSEEDDDLFGSSLFKRHRKPNEMLKSDDNPFKNTPQSSSETVMTVPKKDSISEVARTARANESAMTPDAKRESGVANTTEVMVPSYPSGGLFENLNDDDDSLFADMKVKVLNEKPMGSKEEIKSTIKTEDSSESKIKEVKYEPNSAKLEDLLEKRNSPETFSEKSSEKEREDSDSGNNNRCPSQSPTKKPPEILPKNILKEAKEKKENVSTTDGAKISKPRSSPEINSEIAKTLPPKTLSIRLPMPSAAEDSVQAPRRVVSNKIKNLTNKIGDLKYLSPTDTPSVWRKAEVNADVDDIPRQGRDTEDGSSISVPRAETPAETSSVFDESSSSSTSEKWQDPPPSSPLNDSGNSESAVSFDIPAQVETLAVTASKSRARIPAKRRPQSRYARHSALRQSGIDSDTLDNSSANAAESDPSDNAMAGISDKVPTVVTDPVDSPKIGFGSDRLVATSTVNERGSTDKPVELSSTLAPDDRSEMSMSKDGSMSINKNTLMSPSTDEEDLFDVPPDLPEDPPKGDTIFGRAPILSPTDGFPSPKCTRMKGRSKESRFGRSGPESTTSTVKDTESTTNGESPKKSSKGTKSGEDVNMTNEDEQGTGIGEKDLDSFSMLNKELDPLRDSTRDPLNDPSQLFAFVIKTPSPEKGQNLLFKEDDSLFTRVARKSAEETKTVASKPPALDLFADSSGDLFSVPIAKPPKNSMHAAKSNSLFDDTDAHDDRTSEIFGSGGHRRTEKFEQVTDMVAKKSIETSGLASPGEKSSTFKDDTDGDLFVDTLDQKFSPEVGKMSTEVPENKFFRAASKAAKDSKFEDLFGDQSSGEENIFAPKTSIDSGKASGSRSLFSADTDDEDVTDIFGDKSTKKIQKVEPIENRITVKKPVTRDLKKTAQKIVEDPLSMLQDD